MRTLGLLMIASTLASCSTAPPMPPPPNERAEAQLQRALAGFAVAGPPETCIPQWRTHEMQVIDDDTILFRGTSRLWRNEVRGTCNLLGAGYTLVLRSTSTALCSGEIGQVMELRSGTTVGSCVLGDFIPYERR